MTTRIARPAARLLVVDAERRLLLFRFTPVGAPAFWATPGGAVDPGESYEQAARRELREETGFNLDCGAEVAARIVEFTTVEGQDVWADERFFLVRAPTSAIATDGHTALERRVMTEHRWWTLEALRESRQTVFPDDLADLAERTLIAAEDAPR